MRRPTAATLLDAAGRRLAAATSALALVIGSAALVMSATHAAAAATTTTTPATTATAVASTTATPATVSADALPTVQVDGVVWSQVTVGNTVYATGSFGFARPAGKPLGDPSSVVRSNLLAYDITTGAMTSFAHSLNAQGLVVSASPDGSTVYVGGDFTAVDGLPRQHIAAFSTATGELLTSFAPNVSASVRAIAANNTTVYVGGAFLSVNGNPASRLAAVNASNGALLSWTPTTDNLVTALLISPNGKVVIVAGHFTTLDGLSERGLGAVDATTGAAAPWNTKLVIYDYGINAAFTTLSTDGTVLYGGGYSFAGKAGQGNFEGRFASDFAGNLIWLDSCHGDTYSTFVQGGVVYEASHSHDCSDTGNWDDTTPRTWHRALAETTVASGGTLAHNNNSGYFDFYGQPTNTLLHWFPALAPGTYTGQDQAAWSVTGNSTYVAMGGEFPTVNNAGQQGLVRFAVRSVAPDKQGPYASAGLTPVVTSNALDAVRVSWSATWDPDNATLTYAVYRDGGSTPVYTTSAASNFWTLPTLSFTDSGLVTGSTHSYRVKAFDADGNQIASAVSASVAVGSSYVAPPVDAYGAAVMAAKPALYWRLDDGQGSATAFDTSSNGNTGSYSGGISYLAASTVTGTKGTGVGLNGTTASIAAVQTESAPSVYSEQVWFRTTTKTGGKLIGFGTNSSGTGAPDDRLVYMQNSGKLSFAAMTTRIVTSAGTLLTSAGITTARTVATSTAAYNDGKWHQVVATQTPTAMVLYVDGASVASAAVTGTPTAYTGSWQVGGGNLSGWTARPSSDYFNGTVDEVAVYPTALSAAQVLRSYGASPASTNRTPTAKFTATCPSLYCALTATASSDPDGSVTAWSWNFGDKARGSGATASHSYKSAGTYTLTLTVTDNRGATSSVSHQVTVKAVANRPPVAAFSSSCAGLVCSLNGSRSTDADGAVVTWSWNFADGSSAATGATVKHTFAAAGDYPVTLTVTDNSGARSTVTQTVSPTPAPNPDTAPFASDTFARTLSGGWGTADVGGLWTTSGTASVSSGAGSLTASAGGSTSAYLGTSAAAALRTDADVTTTVTTNQAPTGGGQYVDLVGRRVGANSEYRADLHLLASGAVGVALGKLDGSATETVLAPETIVAGLTYRAGTQLEMRLQVTGTNPTLVRVKVWAAGDTGPASWAASVTDSSAALQNPGAVGLRTYVSGTTVGAPVTTVVTGFAAQPSATPPTAQFGVTCTARTCLLDAGASTDPQDNPGSGISTYAWSFGDGATGAGASASHVYAAAGTYRVTLTVTDTAGFTSVARVSFTVAGS